MSGGPRPARLAAAGQPAMLGLDYRTAPLSLRQRLHLATPGDVEAYLQQLPHPAVVLATCHRVEVYVDDPASLQQAADALARRGGLGPRAIEAHGTRRAGEACVRHLFEVAAGLQSMVVGEPQVLGQVRDALEVARRVRPVGGVLAALFERALHAGKRVRAETTLGRSSPSVARAAVARARAGGLDLARARVLVVGSGEMALLAVREALGAGARRIVVCARRPDHAREALRGVAAVQALPLEALADQIRGADLVISCTTAPGTIVTAAMLLDAVARRDPARGPLWVMDLAVPRDVEVPEPLPPGLHVLSVDEVGAPGGDRAGGAGSEGVAQALAIVGQETAAWMEWLRQRQAAPALVAMRQEAEALRREQVEWALRRLDTAAGPRAREVLERMTHRLTVRLLHLPTRYLKEEAARSETGVAG